MECFLKAVVKAQKKKNRAGEGSVDQWTQVPLTLMRSRMPIRIRTSVKSRIRIRKSDKRGPDTQLEVEILTA
jgi:hypothetical protein